MPCYHPMIRVEDTHKWVKAADGHKYHPAKIHQFKSWDDYSSWDFEQTKKEDFRSGKKEIIPCGQCIGCRLEYSRQWATRGYLESLEYNQNYFVTLTYDEDHLKTNEEITTKEGITYWNEGDWNGTLIPEDATAFMKNLRQIILREYVKNFEKWLLSKPEERKKEPNEPKIRFMLCGEYGEEGERPHLHAILFNCELPTETFYKPRLKNGNWYWQNEIIERAWGYKGICNITDATWNSIAYTARYITKKINGPESEELYASKGQEKEFFRVSRMPGIGENYFREHWEEIYKNDEIIIKSKAGAIVTKPPKYFDRLLEQMEPKTYEKIKQKRRKESKNTEAVQGENTSLFRLQQLVVLEHEASDNAKKLKREYEKKN